MKLQLPLLASLLASLLTLTTPARATVGLQFSSVSSKLTNLADEMGMVMDGMMWGVIIDTSGDGFDHLLSANGYTGFSDTLMGGHATFLSHDGLLTDDYFYLGSAFTATFGGTDGGSGAVSSITDVPNSLFNINANDPFALFWLPQNSASAGSHYGMLSIPAFVMPTDGDTMSYATNFTGPDSVQSADYTFNSAVVPEPGGLMLLSAAAGICVLRRKRRNVVLIPSAI